MKQDTVQLSEMTAVALERLLAGRPKRWGALLPVGCLEQHGPLLPLGCDSLIAQGAAENLARGLEAHEHFGARVLPVFTYTPSPGAEMLTGTVSTEYDWLGAGLRAIVAGALRGTAWDFIAIVNSHAHNEGRVYETSVAGSAGALGRKVPVVVLNTYAHADVCAPLGLDPGSHAGEFEIALYRHYTGDGDIPEDAVRAQTLRPRPPRVFGLDLAPRSRQGVISPEIPRVRLALERAAAVGRGVDEALMQTLLENLDCYFEHWGNA